MAIVRRIPRRFLITIGGLDHSDCIVAYDGGDEKLVSGDGIIQFRGKMSLRRAMGAETLDDRKNKRWNRGTPIAISITDDFGVMRPSPRGSKLFILSAVYNLETRELDIECGDSFALLKQREADGNASGVCLGVGESKTSVINRLLAAAGAPALIDTVPGTIDIPAPKTSGGSYIDQAGKMAVGSGYFLYVDSLNQVRARPIAIELGTPRLTISILDESAKHKRITGESPAAWFVVNSNNQSATSSKYGYESTDEAYGPISIAGVADEGMIVIRREWQKESLSGHKRFVETIVREPIGAVVPLLKGDASSIVSMQKLEIFEYENAAFSVGSNGSGACQSGNQGRLIKRTLNVKQPIGKVLSKIIDSAPEEARPPSLSNPIVSIKEEEEFDYSRIVIATSSTTLPQTGPIDPNQVPPSDPSSETPKKMSGIKHTLKRWEPAGAISPEDYEYDLDQQMWIVVAQDLKQSYQLTKEWIEGRSDEWTFTEREQISFNRYQPEAAAESRARMKERPGTYYKDIFCALMLSRSPRKVSSSGNTQPPAPDTMPSTHGVKNDAKSYKYKMPFDTDFPFRQKKVEITVEHLSIDGNLLAEKLGKVLWGRFKGITVESEFLQHWWEYEPMCRVNILEPNITLSGNELDTSAYLGEAFSIAIANQQCAIGIDGIFLGFVQNNILIPPYVEESFIEISGAIETVWKTTEEAAAPPDPIVSRVVVSASVGTNWVTTLNPITYLRLFPQTNTNRNAPFSASSGNAILNTQTGFQEAYALEATWAQPGSDIYGNTGPTIARYDIQLRKNGGAWSSPIAVSGTAFRMEAIGTALPGISYVNDLDQNKTYVGPGLYEVQVTAIGTAGGRSIVASGSITYPSTIDYISIAGMPSNVNSGDVFTLSPQIYSNTITVAIGSPGYPAIVPIWAIESGSATITQGGEITILNHYLNGSSDPNHAPIVVSLSAVGYENLTYKETIYALNPNGPVIESINIISDFGARQGDYIVVAAEPSTITLRAEVFGQGQFNDDVLWSVTSGSATLSSSQTFDPYETIDVYTTDSYIVITATSQDSTIYTDLTISFQPPGQIISIEIRAYNNTDENESQPMTAYIGDYIDLTKRIVSTGFWGGQPYQSVSWSVIQGAAFVSLTTGGGFATIECLSSTVLGVEVVVKATSSVDSTKFALFNLTIKSILIGIVIVPSVTTIDGDQSFTAQAYLTGQGGGTGVGSIGSQQFLWSAFGPGNVASNSITSTATINSTATAGTINLAATFNDLSASVNISNTGSSAVDLSTLTLVPNYTISHTGDRSYTPFSYNNLNDGAAFTGMAIGKYYTGGGDCSIIVNLGSALLIKDIEITGGYFDPTLPVKISPFASGGFDEVAPYLNGGFIEYSLNGTAWTTYIQIADVTDYDYKHYQPNITAQYWRIRRQLWLATSNLSFYT